MSEHGPMYEYPLSAIEAWRERGRQMAAELTALRAQRDELAAAVEDAQMLLSAIADWQEAAGAPLNPRERRVVQMALRVKGKNDRAIAKLTEEVRA